jgi:signal transduction protein with GAF and PtsI domain
VTDGDPGEPAAGRAPDRASAPDPDRLRDALRALTLRVEAARRIAPASRTAVLRSIVEATAGLFAAEAASIALHDPASDTLVFEVAAGEQGQGVVGLAIDAGQGVAGYVFSTGQPIALTDVASDARFGRTTAEQTGYVPRSLIAVPLADDDGIVGVLEVLDKRGGGAFDLHDLELAGVFARQATVAIRASRVERDTAALLRGVLVGAVDPARDGDVEAIVADAIAALGADGSDPLWALADEIARLARADPAELDLVRELLAVLVRRAEHGSAGRARHGRSR